MAFSFLGTLLATGQNLLHVDAGNGREEKCLDQARGAGEKVVAIVAHTEEAVDQVRTIIQGVQSGDKLAVLETVIGELTDADKVALMQRVFPNLATKHANALITVANGAGQELKKDGKIDFLDAGKILFGGLLEELRPAPKPAAPAPVVPPAPAAPAAPPAASSPATGEKK